MTQQASQPNNALVTLLAQWQDKLREGTSEYALIRALQAKPLAFFSEQAMRDPLLLFQTHFALYNALYQLKDIWLESQQGLLEIHGTRIHLRAYQPQDPALTHADPLRTYYLDWSNFDTTAKHDVEELLDTFWSRMTGEEAVTRLDRQRIDEAMAVLDIASDMHLSKALLKRQYRKRLHDCHPDKGGRAEDTRNVVSAYSVLLPLSS
ncbi:DNA-J related domain-containing protein [Alteromonas sp. H39]|uniref:DNA-J related domain-containing protein n=1 Tax=Alteromonas sp. H39 TaxID=3389876 RepID=UPI0039E1DA85